MSTFSNLQRRLSWWRPRSAPIAHQLVEVDAIFGRLRAFDNDLITRQILQFGAHTRPELAFLLNFIDAGDAVFDLGAHIGTFTIPIAQKVGKSGRVVAVEGDSSIYQVLVENVRNNSLSEIVSAYNMVIAPANSSPRYRKRNTGATFFEAKASSDHASCNGLDDIVAMSFEPNVVKIDIEGLEGWAILHSSYITKSKPILYVEVANRHWERFGINVDDLHNHLRSIGYRFFRNSGPRNARNDDFTISELATLSSASKVYDFLAIHNSNPRMSRTGQPVS